MKSLATAYMTRKFSKGKSMKSPPPQPMESNDNPEPEMQMCEHGGPIMCAEGCYAEGGMMNPKLEQSKMFDGGDIDLEDDEEEGIEDSGDEEDDMPLEMGSSENEEGEDLENMGKIKMAKGGMIKSRLLSQVLGNISKMHRGK